MLIRDYGGARLCTQGRNLHPGQDEWTQGHPHTQTRSRISSGVVPLPCWRASSSFISRSWVSSGRETEGD